MRGLFVCPALVLALGACRTTTAETRPENDANVVVAPPGGQPPKTSGPAPSTFPKPPANVERWGELTRELGAAIRRSGGECPRVASEVQAFVTRYKKELAGLERARQAWEDSATKPAVAAFYRTLRRDLDTRIDAGIRCSSDAVARRAFDSFFVASGLDTRL